MNLYLLAFLWAYSLVSVGGLAYYIAKGEINWGEDWFVVLFYLVVGPIFELILNTAYWVWYQGPFLIRMRQRVAWVVWNTSERRGIPIPYPHLWFGWAVGAKPRKADDHGTGI